MALMEYCLVNIILGDPDTPKIANKSPKPEKIFDLASKVCKSFFYLLGKNFELGFRCTRQNDGLT
jgi:hypothetical protein